jgi:hypothetical protein
MIKIKQIGFEMSLYTIVKLTLVGLVVKVLWKIISLYIIGDILEVI